MDIVERLRAMARYEHDDLSIGDGAAEYIEFLESRWKTMTNAYADAVEQHNKTLDDLADCEKALNAAKMIIKSKEAIQSATYIDKRTVEEAENTLLRRMTEKD